MADSSSVSKKETTTPAMQHSLKVFKSTTEFGTRVWPGSPQPLGATWDGKGVNVAIFSENAERVELCLFDEKGERETARIALPEYTNQKWHGYFPDLRPGHLYRMRVYGPYDPKSGHRFRVADYVLGLVTFAAVPQGGDWHISDMLKRPI